MKSVRDFDLFLLDMDGTIYLGNDLFPETPGFLEAVRRKGARYVFLTNNSSKNKQSYVEKLNRLGIAATEEDVFSSGDATAIWLRENGYQSMYLVGNTALKGLFEKEGFLITENDPDCVVLGFDTELTYEKLCKAHDLLRAGKTWICTHPDLVCPMEAGRTIPDTGAMIRLLEASTGRHPDYIIGKPNKIIIDAALSLYHGTREKTCMVGDRLYTDIAVGKNAGIGSILVLSGETSLEDYENQQEFHADFVYPTVGEIGKELGVRIEE
ncbi:MAG: HAD-IIA family hydrolase [Clostridia bacterium]|nr:HAD-IIA family hydrolase [Clostridia bacterium]